jgi:hypothetical protein
MIGAVIVAAVLSMPARSALPENPCALITAEDIAIVGQLVVQPGRRVPSKLQIVAAEREGRQPAPGTICVFESGVEFGGITVAFEPAAQRSAATYRATRDRYTRTFPGSWRAVPGIGADAWLSGGTTLTVLIGGDDYFSLSTQHYQRESGELLANIAAFILSTR